MHSEGGYDGGAAACGFNRRFPNLLLIEDTGVLVAVGEPMGTGVWLAVGEPVDVGVRLVVGEPVDTGVRLGVGEPEKTTASPNMCIYMRVEYFS